MKVTVQLFAMARMTAGRDTVEIEVAPPVTVAQLRATLGRDYPGLTDILARSMIAIDERYAGEDDLIPAGAEVACLPPVSGG